MMKRIQQFFFVAAGSLFLLACFAINTQAQDPDPNRTTRPRGGRRTVPIKPGTILEGPKISDELAASTIMGVIRWKKEYGLPSIDGGRTPDKATNCTAIRVVATYRVGAPGTFGVEETAGYASLQNEPTEENGYYTCRYHFTRNPDPPRNKVITVSAFLGPYANQALNRALTEGAWYGEGLPRPPAGQQRVVIGGRGITLTDTAPRATVDFEVVYRPIPAPPR